MYQQNYLGTQQKNQSQKTRQQWRELGYQPIPGSKPHRHIHWKRLKISGFIPEEHEYQRIIRQLSADVWEIEQYAEDFLYSAEQVQKIQPIKQQEKQDFSTPEIPSNKQSAKLIVNSIPNTSPTPFPSFPPYDVSICNKLNSSKHLPKMRKAEEWEYLPEGFNWEQVPKKYRDGLRYLFHTLYIHRIIRRMNSEDYININAETFRQVVWNGDAVRKFALGQGYLECDGVYAKGSKSYGYRFNAEIAARIFRLTRRTNRAIINHLRKTEQERSPVVRHLANNLRRIEAVVPPNIPFADELQLLAINEGAIAFNPEDDFGRRFHSNITNLKGELKACLRVEGNPLYQIDIKNSQPLFLALIAQQQGVKCTEYKSIAEQGQLYERLGEQTGLNRQQSKSEMIEKVLFAQLGSKCRTQKAFQALYPDVWQLIERIKAKDYTNLARLLQQAESDFIIRKVCDRIRKEHPKMFLATIHDAVITSSPEDAAKVRCIMQQEFTKLNLNPILEIENLCP